MSLRGRQVGGLGESLVAAVLFPRVIFRSVLTFLVEEAFRVEGVHEDAT